MISNKVALVKPLKFYSNPETRSTNSFQNTSIHTQHDPAALVEFDAVIEKLKDNQIETLVFNSSMEASPDAIFPNNWFLTLPNKSMITFPMLNENRRAEREKAIINAIKDSGGYIHSSLVYLESLSEKSYLEGTGSLVLDHDSKSGFAAISPRTHQRAIQEFEHKTGYKIHTFETLAVGGVVIFHTNVIMTLGEGYAAVGMDLIEEKYRGAITAKIEALGKEIIVLNRDQCLRNFAANMLQVRNNQNERCLLLSTNAFQSLEPSQIDAFKKYNDRIIDFDIQTIERLGGGSLRCMLAELY